MLNDYKVLFLHIGKNDLDSVCPNRFIIFVVLRVESRDQNIDFFPGQAAAETFPAQIPENMLSSEVNKHVSGSRGRTEGICEYLCGFR